MRPDTAVPGLDTPTSPLLPHRILAPKSHERSCDMHAGLSTLQQAAALGYPSTVYVDRPTNRCRLPPWAWLMVAIAAFSILVAGLAPFPSVPISSLPGNLYVKCLNPYCWCLGGNLATCLRRQRTFRQGPFRGRVLLGVDRITDAEQHPAIG